MNIPAFESFSKIGLEDCPVILAHDEKYRPFSSEYGFGCLLIYSQAYGLKYCIFNERLFVLDEDEKCLYMPVGEPLNPDALRDMLIKYREHIPEIYYALFPIDYIESFPELKNYFEIQSYRSETEYLYSTEKLAVLAGGNFLKQRNLISNFRRNHTDYTVEKVSSESINDCMNVAALWAVQKSLTDDEDIIRENNVIKGLFENWAGSLLEGLLIRASGTVVAFAIFSRLDSSTYVIHIEKFDRSIKGLPQILSLETAVYLSGKCEYINKEQDVGLPGLRYSKMSYQPEKLLDTYCLLPKF